MQSFQRSVSGKSNRFSSGSQRSGVQEPPAGLLSHPPEVFDRLYEDWATLERFQRTRGVLRLMAAVIHELWMGSDAGLLIMPGSLPLDVSAVRDELTRHLPEGWNSLVDREVDGKRSVPWQQDKNVLRYGKVLASSE